MRCQNMAMQVLLVICLMNPTFALRTGDRQPPAAPAPAAVKPAAPAAVKAAAPQAAVEAAVPSEAPKNSRQPTVMAIPKAALARGKIPDPKILPAVNRSVSEFNNDTLSEEGFDGAEPVFGDLDCIKRDNVVTLNEAATFGVENGIPWSEVKPIFEYVDANHDGEITKDEFDNSKDAKKIIQDFRPGFRDIDLDGDNLISKTEWMAFCDGWMTPHPTKEVCTELFKASDTMKPKDEIDRQEFENAGKECKSIDDGNCEEFIQLGHNNVNRRIARRIPLAATVLSSWQPRTGAQLFQALLHRHKERYL